MINGQIPLPPAYPALAGNLSLQLTFKLPSMRKANTFRFASFFLMLCGILIQHTVKSQALRLPDGVNLKSKVGRSLGVTDIEINWNAPGVKGREGKIWGTDVANYGFMVLGFGSDVQSPWRAGANESTTISFSTDVTINGARLAAGKYGFFIALYPDSCTLIFNKNTEGWGSYFYNSGLDVLRVTAKQHKNQPASQERLAYTFANQTDESVEAALEWERWRIPFIIKVDLMQTTLASIQAQMSGALGFDPPSLEAAANWCLQNKINQEQALNWINSAVSPSLGGVNSFRALGTKAGLLTQLGRQPEADAIMKAALESASVMEMHGYGRQLLAQGKKKEAMEVFQQNYNKHKGIWPTNGGLMRGYSAMGDLKKALEYGKLALAQAPDEAAKRALEQAVKTLSEGKPL
jgi:tetratricopeptide (TPR) repeat protein